MARETHIAIYALVIIIIGAFAAQYLGVQIDSEQIAMVGVTAIAALVRGDGKRTREDKDEKEGEVVRS